jgi:hypothetical protein
MKDIDKPCKLRQSGYHGLTAKVSQIAAAIAGIEKGFNAFLDENDLVLCAGLEGPGEHLGWYRYGPEGDVHLPQKWRDATGAVKGNRVHKVLDEYQNTKIIRIRIE